MQATAFDLLQKSKKACDKIRAGGENTWKISYGVDRQRSDEQRNGTVRIRKATDGRSNAPQCNGIATICHDRHSNGKAVRGEERRCDATEKQCKAETSNGKATISIAKQREGNAWT